METPEHVTLDYEIAGIGSRALAALVDTLILVIGLLALVAATGVLGGVLGADSWGEALYLVASFLLVWGYFAFFEGLRHGQTPGKRWLGIRVVRDTGHPITLGAAIVRNLLRVADFLPPPYLIGAILVAVHPRGKRLGDLVAGTVVVRDHPAETAAPLDQAPPPDSAELGPPELTDQEFRVLREFADRGLGLDRPVREGLAGRIAAQFAARYPNRPADPTAFLLGLYRAELARRRSRFGIRTGGPGRTGGAARGVADRLVARKQQRWEEFERLATRAARRGLDSFAAEELPDYAARYREVAADLARARTYGAEPAVLARLERLVAAGHNTLYRDERHELRRIGGFLFRECPAAVVEARRYVLLAFLTFTLPAAGGFLLLRERPALAREVLPEVMLERAEAGRERQARGQGYYETSPAERPLAASAIMTNNIGLAFNCFAGGIFFGVGSLVLLAYNGLAIGAVSGHFANAGLLGYLWSFVIGHGVLELFAIWVAGAAGFLLGRALIAPGDLPRREALVLQGRVALRLIGAVVLLLAVAGGVEGFVSTSTAPLPVRLAVSVGSLVLLLLYLGNGWLAAAGTREALRSPAG
ncbi:MAG TPA: stage II sporulation protein M [Gemmatimonadales bacterium]|nr:stage II sporulation protein M [Gemmatimonadales bacterium]